MNLWLIIIIIGILTFSMRLSFIGALGRNSAPPERLQRALRFLPAAVLSAIVVPDLLYRSGVFSPGNPRLLAGIIAAVVAWKTHNAILTLAAGMIALWVLQTVFA